MLWSVSHSRGRDQKIEAKAKALRPLTSTPSQHWLQILLQLLMIIIIIIYTVLLHQEVVNSEAVDLTLDNFLRTWNNCNNSSKVGHFIKIKNSCKLTLLNMSSSRTWYDTVKFKCNAKPTIWKLKSSTANISDWRVLVNLLTYYANVSDTKLSTHSTVIFTFARTTFFFGLGS